MQRRSTAALPIADLEGTKTALILIDVQGAWVPEVIDEFPAFPGRVMELLAWARENPKLVHIVHIRAEYKAEEANGRSAWIPHFKELNPEKSSEAKPILADFAESKPGEYVFDKPTFDAFLKTDLEKHLVQHGIKQTLLCGLVTSACVQATAHSAFARGFCPVLVEDCCADRTRAKHEAVLSIYGGYMYKLCRVEDCLKFRENG